MEVRTINLKDWNKERLVRVLFYIGLAIAVLGSTTPWFFWPLGEKTVIISSALLLASMGVANTTLTGQEGQKADGTSFYSRQNFIIPLTLYIVVIIYTNIVKGQNVNAYIVKFFSIIPFYAIFRVRLSEISKFCDVMAKALGGFLVLSMFTFFLYLIGFSLPSRNAELANLYSCTNYFFFLIDDRTLFFIIPRFQSIFAEPGHLGTFAVMLLFTQIGKWKRWYNISLLIAVLISFSLAAYGLLIPVIFLGLWIRRQQMVKNFLYTTAILSSLTIASFYYNDGDNLLHDFIMVRLEIEDGEMAGDNRVTEDFKVEYENFINSQDILTGRDRDMSEFGNSGYRVFIYDYGLIGLFLLASFYLVVMYQPDRKREFISVIIIATLNFIIRGNILQLFIFVYLYQVAKNSLLWIPQNAS